MAKQNKHTKEQLISSEKYGKYRDLLSAVLIDGKEYTEKEVNKIISDYMEKRVE